MYLTVTRYLQSNPLSTYNPPNTKNNTYFINHINLIEIQVSDESKINWSNITSQYLLDVLGIKHDIPYNIVNIYMNADTIVFEVTTYVINLGLFEAKVTDSLKQFHMITVKDTNLAMPYYKYFYSEDDVKSSTIVVNVIINNKMFKLLGKNILSIRLSLIKLDDIVDIFFDSFRTVCKSEPVLWDMFIDCIDRYKIDCKKDIQSIINLA